MLNIRKRLWQSPRPIKEMKNPNPNNSFDKVMTAIAILALIGFVVGLFKIMGYRTVCAFLTAFFLWVFSPAGVAADALTKDVGWWLFATVAAAKRNMLYGAQRGRAKHDG